MKKRIKRFFQKGSAIIATLVLSATQIMAQSSAGIDQATAEVSSYVDPVSNLIIAIGAVVGLIGGVRVYIKWQSGDQDTQKAIMGWFGACLFLILVGVVIKSFFA
jgi:phage-related minor tail protein